MYDNNLTHTRLRKPVQSRRRYMIIINSQIKWKLHIRAFAITTKLSIAASVAHDAFSALLRFLTKALTIRVRPFVS